MALMALAVGTSWGQTTPHVAIGDILCSDNSTVRREDWPASGKTPIGIVFYVEYSDSDGKWHGSAIHLSEAHDLMWAGAGSATSTIGSNATNVVKVAVSDWDGAGNTSEMVGKIGSSSLTSSKYPVLYYVNKTLGGQWYLPAMGQLHYLYGYIDEINRTVEELNSKASGTAVAFGPAEDDFPSGNWSYWPSTEYDASSMWFLNYNGDCAGVPNPIDEGCTATPAAKSNQMRVRAAIDF